MMSHTRKYLEEEFERRTRENELRHALDELHAAPGRRPGILARLAALREPVVTARDLLDPLRDLVDRWHVQPAEGLPSNVAMVNRLHDLLYGEVLPPDAAEAERDA
jgi:hypothetical protein